MATRYVHFKGSFQGRENEMWAPFGHIMRFAVIDVVRFFFYILIFGICLAPSCLGIDAGFGGIRNYVVLAHGGDVVDFEKSIESYLRTDDEDNEIVKLEYVQKHLFYI